VTVGDDRRGFDRSGRGEQRLEVLSGGCKREVPYEQLLAHGMSSLGTSRRDALLIRLSAAACNFGAEPATIVPDYGRRRVGACVPLVLTRPRELGSATLRFDHEGGLHMDWKPGTVSAVVRRSTMSLGIAAVAALLATAVARANVPLTRVSSDPFTNPTSQ